MQYFTKPWAMTTVMFLGMSFCLPWAYWEEYKHKKQAKEALQSANGDISDPLLYGESLVSCYLLATFTSGPSPKSCRMLFESCCQLLSPAYILLFLHVARRSAVGTLHKGVTICQDSKSCCLNMHKFLSLFCRRDVYRVFVCEACASDRSHTLPSFVCAD